jgi:DNA-binding transcriptional LysR family regulator
MWVGVSAKLYQYLDAGELDLVLAKRPAADDRGQLVWRDRLVWIGTSATHIDVAAPVPLILYNPPSITRAAALRALERHGLTWRVACVSGSLSGLRAAALAGLGVTVHARGLIPDGLIEMKASSRLPELDDVEFVLMSPRTGSRGPAAALAQTILANGDRLRRAYDAGRDPSVSSRGMMDIETGR